MSYSDEQNAYYQEQLKRAAKKGSKYKSYLEKERLHAIDDRRSYVYDWERGELRRGPVIEEGACYPADTLLDAEFDDVAESEKKYLNSGKHWNGAPMANIQDFEEL